MIKNVIRIFFITDKKNLQVYNHNEITIIRSESQYRRSPAGQTQHGQGNLYKRVKSGIKFSINNERYYLNAIT